jgi:hypothetical protein
MKDVVEDAKQASGDEVKKVLQEEIKRVKDEINRELQVALTRIRRETTRRPVPPPGVGHNVQPEDIGFTST